MPSAFSIHPRSSQSRVMAWALGTGKSPSNLRASHIDSVTVETVPTTTAENYKRESGISQIGGTMLR